MTTIQRIIAAIRSHMPTFLHRDTTATGKDQQAVAGTTSHG